MKNTAMNVLPALLFVVLLLTPGACITKSPGNDNSGISGPSGQIAGETPGTLNAPDGETTIAGTGSGDYFSDGKTFPLTHDQIVKHLRAANEAAKKAKESGHHPFGAVLVAPDGETVLMTQGNMGGLSHAETELSRRASVQYDPAYLWNCTLVTTFEPCAMCAGNIYWANIGNMAYGLPETTLRNLTGASKANPTMNLPSRTVFGAGQKPIRVAGPFTELEDELVAPHRDFWK